MTHQYDYYYGIEAEQFSFYRIPKILFKDERFKGISSEAKLLYGLMLDRMSLSMKNGWMDEMQRVYIYYTVEHIMDDLGCAQEKCSKVVAELKKIGLIEKKRQGLGKPDIIYVKNFVNLVSNELLEVIGQEPEIRKADYKKSENRISGHSINDEPEVGKTNTNKTEYNNTNNKKTNHIISDKKDVIGEMEKVRMYEELIKENILYDSLLQAYPREKDMIEGMFELILETVICENDYIVISRNEYPMELVKSKFLKLNYGHVEYVLECMRKNIANIRNIKKYMLAALFNASSTIGSYYKAQVNHDMSQLVYG